MLIHMWKEKMWKQTSESERRMFTAPTPRVDNGEVMNTFAKKVCNCNWKAAKLQRVSFAQPSLNAACTRPNQTIFSLTPFSNFLSNNLFFSSFMTNFLFELLTSISRHWTSALSHSLDFDGDVYVGMYMTPRRGF